MPEIDSKLTNNELNYSNFEKLLGILAIAWHIPWVSKTLPEKNGFSAVISEFNKFKDDPAYRKGEKYLEGSMSLIYFSHDLESLEIKKKDEWKKLAFLPIVDPDGETSLLLINGKPKNIYKISPNEVDGPIGYLHECYPLISGDGRLEIFGGATCATFSPDMQVLPLREFHKEPNFMKKLLNSLFNKQTK